MPWGNICRFAGTRRKIVADRVYLAARDDEANMIDVDTGGIRVVFNGESRWFQRSGIGKVCLNNTWEPSALVAGVLMGVLGFLALGVSPFLGVLLVAAGGLAFAVGMEWRRRLEISFNSRYIYSLTFFTRGVSDIHAVLTRYGYLKTRRFRFPARP